MSKAADIVGMVDGALADALPFAFPADTAKKPAAKKPTTVGTKVGGATAADAAAAEATELAAKKRKLWIVVGVGVGVTFAVGVTLWFFTRKKG